MISTTELCLSDSTHPLKLLSTLANSTFRLSITDVERKGNLLNESRSEGDGFISYTFEGEKNLAALM